MKALKISAFLFLFFTSLIEFGCKGDAGTTGPVGPSGPSYRGKITGSIILIDTNGIQPSNKSGVTVSI